MIRSIVERIGTCSSYDTATDEIGEIINEELQAFYTGDKTASLEAVSFLSSPQAVNVIAKAVESINTANGFFHNLFLIKIFHPFFFGITT